MDEYFFFFNLRILVSWIRDWNVLLIIISYLYLYIVKSDMNSGKYFRD